MQGVRDAMDKLSSDMRSKIVEVIERVGADGEDALRLAILEELAPVLEAADALAAEMAAAVFNGWRYQALGLTMDTVTETAYSAGKIEAMANTAAKKAREGATAEELVDIVYGRGAYDLRRSYGQTMISNVRRDPTKPRFARVPGRSEHYSDGCPFCRMLASRDFVYHSRKTAGDFDHYHPDCTCQVVSSWDDKPEVDGYDPDAYYDEYKTFRAEAGEMKKEAGDKSAIDARDISAAANKLGQAGRIKPDESSRD